MIPEINVIELADKIKSDGEFLILDVREPDEITRASIGDKRLIVCPMSQLVRGGTKALPEPAQLKDSEIFVLCHHGNRSTQVSSWLMSRGWTRIFNIAGGIDEYARKVDPSVGIY